MNNENKVLFNAIIEELGRMEERMNKRFDKIEDTPGSLHHEVNACKLERESVSILLKKIDQLERRIEELEKRTA